MINRLNTKKLGIACLLGSAMLFLCLLEFFFRRSALFADWVDRALGAPIRGGLARLFAWVPFSLTGLLLLSLPLLFLLILLLGYRALDKKGGFSRFLLSVLSLFCVFALLFSLTLSPGYHKPKLSETLSLSLTKPRGEELSAVTAWLSGLLSGAPPPAPSWEELTGRLKAAYQALGERYGFPTESVFSVKKAQSGALSALGIIGLYAFPFGEITVNPDYPQTALAFTLSHEMAHALGFSREEEADLLAFLACLESKDAYLGYAGALGMLQRVLPDLRESSSVLWEQAGESLPNGARSEMEDWGRAYEKTALPTMADEERSGHEGLSALLCAYYRRFVSPEASSLSIL